mmetsp:Transcript_14348/g.30677  ORF Transcript_14348/g.30677 Transcript_14348/m.30677 type:complete len:247 (-) Transcript_14348:69-809(-)
MIHVGGILIAGTFILTYNAAVDLYGDHRMKKMAAIPPLECRSSNDENAFNPHHDDVMTASELRQTVSSRSGIVEKLDDRWAWNKWLLTPSPLPSNDQQLGEKKSPLVPPGTYTFMYRSNVKFDEKNAIKKALLHVPTLFGFVAVRRGTLVFHPDGKHVTNTEHFRQHLLTPITIAWEGVVSQLHNKPAIVWTGTSMITGRGKEEKTVVNPPTCEKLRQTPWHIIKVQDGIVGLRRGDDGMLAYGME